jgi:hypothetical protein
VKILLLLVCVLALPGLAQARDGGAIGQPSDRSTRNTILFREMQRRAHEQDQEWRRRDDEQRRRTEEERQKRFQPELLRPGEQKQQGGVYREPEYKDKPLEPREPRRYDLIRPGQRP